MISSKFPNRVKYEIFIVIAVFCIAFLFPFCTFYYEGESEAHIIEKPQYINDFGFGYAYAVYMMTTLLALISANKVVLNILNILVLIFLALTYMFLKLGFAWWGASPFHPTFGVAFTLVNITIFYFVFRSFFWIDSVILYSNKTKFKLVLAISIPLIFIMTVFYLFDRAAKQPVMRGEGFLGNQIRDNRIIRQEDWDYLEAYDGFATKYFSKPVSDSLKDTYVLDSVRFSFSSGSPYVGDRFTLPAKNGKLDIERVFEEYL